MTLPTARHYELLERWIQEHMLDGASETADPKPPQTRDWLSTAATHVWQRCISERIDGVATQPFCVARCLKSKIVERFRFLEDELRKDGWDKGMQRKLDARGLTAGSKKNVDRCLSGKKTEERFELAEERSCRLQSGPHLSGFVVPDAFLSVQDPPKPAG